MNGGDRRDLCGERKVSPARFSGEGMNRREGLEILEKDTQELSLRNRYSGRGLDHGR